MLTDRAIGYYWAKSHSNANVQPYFRGAAGWAQLWSNTDKWADDDDFYWIDGPENRILEPKVEI